MSDSDSDDIINFYELDEVKEFTPEYHNPCYNEETFPVKHPFRALVVGSSGSGKTNITMNIIQKSSGTFNSIMLFTANKKEPLYEYLESVIPAEQLEIYEGLSHLNSMDLNSEIGSGGQVLVIFDDLVLSKDQGQIETLYLRGRKANNNSGISILYLSQSYHMVPSVIRKNITFIIIKRLGTRRDRTAVVRECSGQLEKEDLLALYEYCVTNSFKDFLFIDLGAEENKRYRKNFRHVLSVE